MLFLKRILTISLLFGGAIGNTNANICSAANTAAVVPLAVVPVAAAAATGGVLATLENKQFPSLKVSSTCSAFSSAVIAATAFPAALFIWAMAQDHAEFSLLANIAIISGYAASCGVAGNLAALAQCLLEHALKSESPTTEI